MRTGGPSVFQGSGPIVWPVSSTSPSWCVTGSPRQAAELALAIAEAVDRKVAILPDDFVAKNAAAGSPLNLSRAVHRKEHLDEIERVLPSRS